MTGPQPPSIPAFYPGATATPQLNVASQALAFLLNRATFRARRTTAWTVTEGVLNNVPFDQIDEDSHGGWAAGSPTRYTVQAPGWYLVSAQVSLNGTGATGLVLISYVLVNGTSQTGQGTGWEGSEIFIPTGAGTKSTMGVWEVYANQGDYIEIAMLYTTESAITAADVSAGWQPRVEIVWMGV